MKRAPMVAAALALLFSTNAGAFEFYDGPNLGLLSSTWAFVRWETAQPTTGHVRYGTTRTFEQRTKAKAAAAEHRALLTGLAPNQRYFYAVYEGDERRSDIMAFRTDPTHAPPPIVGDHGGLFVRFDIGIGGGRTLIDLSLAGRVGYSVLPGLIVHANFVSLGSSVYDLDLFCEANCDPPGELTGYVFTGYGLGATAYSDGNYFLTLSGLVGTDTTRYMSGKYDLDRPVVGASMGLGHEWWFSESWGLGVGFELLQLWSQEEERPPYDRPLMHVGLPATTGRILLSATWN